MKINATKISHNTCILSSLEYHGSRHKQIRSGSNKQIAEEKKSVARAISQTPGVFPLNSKPYGLAYSDWAGKWWQWAISIPSNINPLTDNTGTHCAERQQGPVWFLPGTSGGKIDRTCTIPSGKAILLNILTGECSTKENKNLKTAPELLKCAVNSNKGAYSLSASVDGFNIPNIQTYRVQSPSINVVYPPASQSIFPVAEGGPAISAADGLRHLISILMAS